MEVKGFGYKKLIVWQNAAILRKKVYDLTKTFPKSELRRVSQMQDAARSVKQNIQEGYSRKALGDYIRSIEISKGSLGELMGDLDDCHEDELITSEVYTEINKLCIRTHYLFDRLLFALYKKRKSENTSRKSLKVSV